MTCTHQAGLRFCIAFATWTAGLCCLVSLLNFLVNPHAQYRSTWLPPLVQTSRTEKVELLDRLAGRTTGRPEGLILGSSRVLKLEPDYLKDKTGYRFFNGGVNHACVEDYLAFYRYFQETLQRAPKTVILGLDVFAFSNGLGVDARLLRERRLARHATTSIRFRDYFKPVHELLSWKQTKSSLDSLRHHLLGNGQEKPAETFRADGLIVYHNREREIQEGSYDFQTALNYNLREYSEIYARFKGLSERRKELFREFVETCNEHHSRLVVFLTPLHPQLSEHLRRNTSYIAQKRSVVHYVEELATHFDFTFVDFSEVSLFGGDSARFVDGIHPLEQNTRRMIDCLVEIPPKLRHYAVQ